MTFVGGDRLMYDPRAAFVRFKMATIEAFPRGLKMGLAPAAPARRRGIAGNNRRMPIEGVTAAQLARFRRFDPVVAVAHATEVSKDDAM